MGRQRLAALMCSCLSSDNRARRLNWIQCSSLPGSSASYARGLYPEWALIGGAQSVAVVQYESSFSWKGALFSASMSQTLKIHRIRL